MADNSVDFVNLLQKDKEVELCAFIGNGKRWKADEELIGNLEIQGTPVRLIAKRLRVINDQSVIKLTWTPSAYTLAEILDAFGKIPLPPYLNREEEKLMQTAIKPFMRNTMDLSPPPRQDCILRIMF